jgi:hypothetical protein
MYKLLLVVVGALCLAACEPDQSTTRYAQGEYSGKPDAKPWASAPFDGDKMKWDNALRQRTSNQNEYIRVH